MSYKGWIGGLLLGLVFGVLVGLAQVHFVDKDRYVASTVLGERILFDEFWAAAPKTLVKADLMRTALSKDASQADYSLELVVGEMLNTWFRLLDDNLFRFPIDVALQSNSVDGARQRYARINSGLFDGINQRSIIFRVVGTNPDTVESELLDWVRTVKERSALLAQQSLKSWLSRKANGLEVLAEEGGFGISESDRSEFRLIALDFKSSADSLPILPPYVESDQSVSIDLVPISSLFRVLIWGLVGIGCAVLVLIALKFKRYQ